MQAKNCEYDIDGSIATTILGDCRNNHDFYAQWPIPLVYSSSVSQVELTLWQWAKSQGAFGICLYIIVGLLHQDYLL